MTKSSLIKLFDAQCLIIKKFIKIYNFIASVGPTMYFPVNRTGSCC